MKKLLAIIISCCVAVSAVAQRINDSSIVKDSTGTPYPPAVWKHLLMKGYALRPVDPKDKNTEFVLFKLSEEQLAARMERMPKPRESEYFTSGKKISLFKTSDMNGNKIDLRNLNGKIVVMNFWFINCPPCRTEIPDLNDVVDSFKNNDRVVFVAVALDARSDLKEFLETTPFKYQIIDNGQYYAKNYGVKSYPTHVIVDPEGKVYFHTTGLATNTVYWIKKSIKELLAKDVTVASGN